MTGALKAKRFNPYDIVSVPFPYTDKPSNKRRPAIAVSNDDFHDDYGLVWLVMVTSATNAPCKSDIAIIDYERCGLPAASVIRPAKLATIECDLIIRRVGALSSLNVSQLKAQITKNMDI